VKRGTSHYFVPMEEVDWIDVADNYLRLHTGARIQFARGTMKSAEDELDPERFVRVHRSAMVAIDRIRSVRSVDGTQVVELANGVQLRCSRQYARRVSSLLR
jgi:two-component system LytT family response regulator